MNNNDTFLIMVIRYTNYKKNGLKNGLKAGIKTVHALVKIFAF